jgi:hypothetical protein
VLRITPAFAPNADCAATNCGICASNKLITNPFF